MGQSWVVSADLLARSRFVISPFSETVAALTVLSRPDPPGAPWIRSFRALHREAYLAMLAEDKLRAVVADHAWRPRRGQVPGWIADFLALPPLGDDATFTDELDQLAAWDDDRIRAEIVTLHVEYDDSPNEISGTDFGLVGVTDAAMASAKSLFLKFAGEEILEAGEYGAILRRRGNTGRVYISGVLASEESNFLFSYNITCLTESMKKRLNRERLNVGRTTYADRVKSILRGAKSEQVGDLLIDQVGKRATGEQCDEMGWIEISQMALNLMHERNKVAYFTEEEIQSRPNILDNAKSDGYEVVVISDQQKSRLESQVQTGGPKVRTLETYVQEYNASFEYKFVDIKKLNAEERRVYELTPKILALVGLSADRTPDIRISETMRATTDDTEGVWDSAIRAIVIKRSKLSSVLAYAGTLLHEAGHATTGAVDATREFERVLTEYLGKTSTAAIGTDRAAKSRTFWRR